MSLEKPAPGEVHLYEINLDAPFQSDVLSEDERARAARFRFDRDRDRYTAGRTALRLILGGYLGKTPGSLFFSYNPAGKPSVRGIEFNLAHSGPHALIAISADGQVGMDIEQVRAFPEMDDVAKTVFSANELQRWRALPAEKRVDRFYRLWTRKEAFLKGLGEGIAHRLKEVELTFENPPQILAGATTPWSLQDVSKSEDLIAAVAYEGPRLVVRSYELGAA